MKLYSILQTGQIEEAFYNALFAKQSDESLSQDAYVCNPLSLVE